MGCGCLLAPFSFLKWAFTNGVKGYVILGIVIIALLIGFFVIRGVVHDAMTPDPVPAVEQIPARSVAPYEVTTWSRTYYAKLAVKAKDGIVTMTDYWEFINGKWTLTKGTFTFDKTFGDVSIKKRRN